MKLRITVHGVAYDVDVEILDAGDMLQRGQVALASHAAPPLVHEPGPDAPPHPAAEVASGAASAGNGHGVDAPIAGTVLELRVHVGDQVQASQVVAVIEAMKMKTEIAAPAAGTVVRCHVAAGDAVREGQALLTFA